MGGSRHIRKERIGNFSNSSPSPPAPLHPQLFLQAGEGGKTGLPRRRRRGGGGRRQLAGCGRPVGRVQAPAPSFPADADSPSQPGPVVLGALESGSGLSLALLPDPASNVGRAFQRELGGLPSLAKQSPKTEERISLSPPKSWPSPTCPSCFPTWEMGERTRNSICV